MQVNSLKLKSSFVIEFKLKVFLLTMSYISSEAITLSYQFIDTLIQVL